MSTTVEHPVTVPAPTAPSRAAVEATARLERAFGFTTVEVAETVTVAGSRSMADWLAREASSHVRVTPEVQCAVARYKVASTALAAASRVMGTRDLTAVEASDFEYVQDVMRDARDLLAAAGQLHLIGVR